jgi:hypothetical protein
VFLVTQPSKKESPEKSSNVAQVLAKVLIPGVWTDNDNLIARIAHSGKRPLNDAVSVEFRKPDPALLHCFLSTGFQLVNQYRGDVHHLSHVVLTAPCSSVDQAKELFQAIDTLLHSGGVGCKIENSGRTLLCSQWPSEVSPSLATLLDSLAACYGNEQGVFTCGMCLFGLRDLFSPLPFEEKTIHLLRSFAWYLLTERPEFGPDATFSPSEDAQQFKIVAEGCKMFSEEDDPFHNPFGVWSIG